MTNTNLINELWSEIDNLQVEVAELSAEAEQISRRYNSAMLANTRATGLLHKRIFDLHSQIMKLSMEEL